MFFHKPKLDIDFHGGLLLNCFLSVSSTPYRNTSEGGIMAKVIFGLLIFVVVVLLFLLFWIVVLSAALLFFGKKGKRGELSPKLPVGG